MASLLASVRIRLTIPRCRRCSAQGRTVDLAAMLFGTDGLRCAGAPSSVAIDLHARPPGSLRDLLRNAFVGPAPTPTIARSTCSGALRRKIEPDPKAPRFILTVPGGYKFPAQPQRGR